MEKIIISIEDISLEAELNDSLTAQKILDDLPYESIVNIWGDEIYFNIPTKIELDDDSRAEVGIGELGYWPVGPAFCIFFGPTPVSIDEKPRAYSPVNVFGNVTGDLSVLKKIPNGAQIRVEKK